MERSKLKLVSQTKPRAAKPKMSRLHKKRLIWLAGLFVLILAIGGWQLYHVHSQLTTSQAAVAKAQAELHQVKAKKSDLKVQVDQLHNSDYLAKLVRQKYMVSKSGEVIFELPGTSGQLDSIRGTN